MFLSFSMMSLLEIVEVPVVDPVRVGEDVEPPCVAGISCRERVGIRVSGEPRVFGTVRAIRSHAAVFFQLEKHEQKSIISK